MPDVLPLNATVPDFELAANDGRNYRLKQYLGNSALLLFFYPADFTPVCTAEVKAFCDDYSLFRERGITIFGISSDSVERHRNFADTCRSPFRLLSDPDLEIARRFGAVGLFSMRRAYYYIDIDGILRWQHAEVLPVFKLSNSRILEQVDRVERERRQLKSRRSVERSGRTAWQQNHEIH